jgi:hypothetical protein
MTRIGDKWSPVMLADLKRHFDEGLEARQIAARLNAAYGTQLSKSAVIGRLNRLGLFRKGTASQRLASNIAAHQKRRRERKVVLAPPNPPHVPAGAVILPIRRVVTVAMPSEMLERSRCCWPVTNEAPWLFCGLPKADGDRAYCDRHRSISIRPARRAS